MTRRMIQVGTGGFGTMWCKEFLPPFVANGLIEVVAAVDVSPEALGKVRPSRLPCGSPHLRIAALTHLGPLQIRDSRRAADRKAACTTRMPVQEATCSCRSRTTRA